MWGLCTGRRDELLLPGAALETSILEVLGQHKGGNQGDETGSGEANSRYIKVGHCSSVSLETL